MAVGDRRADAGRGGVALEAAIFGFIGVVFGSISTALLTIYKERVTSRREIEQRDRQYDRDQTTVRDVFQRDSVLALQTAVTSLISAAYAELDRQLAIYRETGVWEARTWDTPTAAQWSTALLSLENARARVFNDELRRIAVELREQAGASIWAGQTGDRRRTQQTPGGVEHPVQRCCP
jgi:hypothetical protein